MLFDRRHADLWTEVPCPGHLSTVSQHKTVDVGQTCCDVLTAMKENMQPDEISGFIFRVKLYSKYFFLRGGGGGGGGLLLNANENSEYEYTHTIKCIDVFNSEKWKF